MHVYGSEAFATPFYVLQYSNVVPHGHLLLTAGLSDYAEQIGSRLEIALTVDQYVDELGDFLITALHFAVRQKLPIAEGFSLQGLSGVNATLANAIGKEAVYFTKLRVAPDRLSVVPDSDPRARVIGGVLISASENEYFLDHGAKALESKLTEAILTSPNIKRAPVV